MGFAGVALGRCGIGDDRAQHDERWALGLVARGGEGGIDGLEVVAIGHVQHPPAISLEAPACILGEAQPGIAVDGDAVVIVDERELAQLQVPGEACGLAGDALHQVAVTDERPGAVIDDRGIGLVEARGKKALGHRHAHGIADALPERPCGDLDARCMSPLRMPRCPGVPLPEVADFVQREIISAEMQQAVQQHRRVAARQDEPVTVLPGRVGGIVPEMPRPEQVGHRCQGHRRPGMAGIGLFHRVHREDADGIDADPGVECQAGRRARCGGASGFHRQGVLLSSGAVAWGDDLSRSQR